MQTRRRERKIFAIELRQLNYGSYRILFTLSDTVVKVLHVRHALRRGDLDDIA